LRGRRGGGAPGAGALSNAGSSYGTPELIPLLGDPLGTRRAVLGLGRRRRSHRARGRKDDYDRRKRRHPRRWARRNGRIRGGSGGAILLEAPVVQMLGLLAANGGAGSAYGGGDGADATASSSPAPSKTVTTGGGRSPRKGGSRRPTRWRRRRGTFVGRQQLHRNCGVIWGGAAGRIRVNTASASAQISGLVSPSTTTACVSQGKLKLKSL